MANGEIKIHLATYLKDAGIKATSQQVDKLAEKVKNANREMQKAGNESVGSIGKVQGPLGKLQDALGGVTGKFLAVVAAFKTGWEIGTWIREKIVWPMMGWKSTIDEIKEKNAELERDRASAAKSYQEATNTITAYWDAQVSGADRAKKSIDDATAAYLKLQSAQGKVIAAENDAKMLGMQRAKFDDMAGAASPEEAAALGKHHDILIAEERTKQQIAEFDRQQVIAAEKLDKADQARYQARQKLHQLSKEEEAVEKRLAYANSQNAAVELGYGESERLASDLEAKIEKIKADIKATGEEIRKRTADIEAANLELSAGPQERENIQKRAELELDEKKKAYDEYVTHVYEEQQKAAQEEWQREQQEIQKRVADEKAQRARMEQELAQQRLADLKTELSERQREEGAARSRQGAAGSNLTRAWGLYRNQSSMQALIDEQKAQAEAEKQWQKDFDRLRSRRRDWRTAEFGSLSAADESVRQVALAKEEKEAADRAVIETAENTRELAEKLDELLKVKG